MDLDDGFVCHKSRSLDPRNDQSLRVLDLEAFVPGANEPAMQQRPLL